MLGGGPAGLAAAYKLSQRGWSDVTVLERGEPVGGNAGSFVIDGIPVDFGSHRLHPVCPPAVMADIRALLGDDLLDRPRHGRIRLRGRWVHFPLKPFDLLTRLPPAFMRGRADRRRSQAASAGEPASRALRRFSSAAWDGRSAATSTFRTREKIWGLPPERTRSRAGQAPRLERIARQDGAPRAGRAARACSGPAPAASSIRARATARSARRCTARRSTRARPCISTTNVTGVVLERRSRASTWRSTVGGETPRASGARTCSRRFR